MNRIAKHALAFLTFAGLASAATVVCPAPPNSGVPVNLTSDLVVMCGGLTFNNFQVIPFAGNTSPVISLGSVDFTGGFVNLTFNPNMSAPPSGTAQDIHLLYQVSGASVSAIDLSVGGVNASIIETACSAPIPTTGPQANLCPTGTFLGNMTAFSSPPGPNSAVIDIPASSAVWIFKDIGVLPNSPNAGGGGLSNFTQSFHAVPEPLTFLLLGPALLGLGLVRRKLVR